jgi:hypothetical protein
MRVIMVPEAEEAGTNAIKGDGVAVKSLFGDTFSKSADCPFLSPQFLHPIAKNFSRHDQRPIDIVYVICVLQIDTISNIADASGDLDRGRRWRGLVTEWIMKGFS